MNAKRPSGRSANIFINYRRDDSAGHTGRLFDRLSDQFPGRVFMDIDTIEPGVDFAEVIEQAVGSCEILIVVIGREWLNVKDGNGRRRLDNPEDFVRLEVAKALERKIRVIPVLVEDAPMPRPEDLPEDLVRLARRNAIELSDARWDFDVNRLIQTIERVLLEKESPVPAPEPPALSPPVLSPEAPRRSRTLIAASALLVVLVLAGWTGWRLVKPPAPEKAAEAAEITVPQSLAEPAVPAVIEAPPQLPVEPEPQPPQEETAVAPEEAPALEPEEQVADYGPDTCKKGFVWREARPGDHVCVTPYIREQTAEDNLQASARRYPAGDYGPDTCLSGYVWREAFDGDRVCVTPETRKQAQLDNSKARERRMRSLVRWTKSLRKEEGDADRDR